MHQRLGAYFHEVLFWKEPGSLAAHEYSNLFTSNTSPGLNVRQGFKIHNLPS